MSFSTLLFSLKRRYFFRYTQEKKGNGHVRSLCPRIGPSIRSSWIATCGSLEDTYLQYCILDYSYINSRSLVHPPVDTCLGKTNTVESRSLVLSIALLRCAAVLEVFSGEGRGGLFGSRGPRVCGVCWRASIFGQDRPNHNNTIAPPHTQCANVRIAIRSWAPRPLLQSEGDRIGHGVLPIFLP